MQAVCKRMHSRTSGWRADGFNRGFMRSILQLRTPQSSNGDQHSLGGVSVPIAVENATPKVSFREPQIEMAHGAGGKASRRLVEGLFAPLFGGPLLGPLGDAAHLDVNGIEGGRLAFTTDSFVVSPLRFPGGSIGDLAVNGNVND